MLFIDVIVDYRQNAYLFFSSLSTYLFLATALAYQLLILKITFLSRKVFLLDGSQEDHKLKRHNTYWRWAVISLIIAIILTFLIDFFVEQGNSETTNQLNRGCIIVCYLCVGTVFIYFSCRLLNIMTKNLQGYYDVKHTRKVSQTEYLRLLFDMESVCLRCALYWAFSA